MIPERLGGGCFLAVVTDAVIHLFRRMACQLVHRGLERKWRWGDAVTQKVGGEM